MSENHAPDIRMVEHALAHCNSEMDAPEADGTLLALTAMLGNEALPVWLQQVVSADLGESVDALAQPLLDYAQARIALLEENTSLPQLCLPDDEDDPRDRVQALSQWAAGFLSGLGQGAAMRGTPARESIEQEPLAEIIADLTQITGAELAAEDIEEDREAAEAALVEIEEFLRVACQLCYEELLPVRALSGGANGPH